MSRKDKSDKKGGLPARIGFRFHKRMFFIIEERLRKNPTDKVSLEKLSNMIVKHKDWTQIEKELINLPEEELEELLNK